MAFEIPIRLLALGLYAALLLSPSLPAHGQDNRSFQFEALAEKVRQLGPEADTSMIPYLADILSFPITGEERMAGRVHLKGRSMANDKTTRSIIVPVQEYRRSIIFLMIYQGQYWYAHIDYKGSLISAKVNVEANGAVITLLPDMAKKFWERESVFWHEQYFK